jgi:pimeloyl-ACP methyl ester carboxylesterase
MRQLSAFFALLFSWQVASAQQPTHLERPVCGWFMEPVAFDIWRRAAGHPNPERVAEVPIATAVDFKTSDQRLLRGYRLAAKEPKKGTILFAQGNAMLADQMLRPLAFLANRGYAVYVYDFRGYGRSEGVPRLNAISSDYRELAAQLASRKAETGKVFLYGVSFGGLLLMNALSADTRIDAAVIDSAPSRATDEGCPATFDPIAHVPLNAQHLLVIRGEKDRVVPPTRTAALAERVAANGGKTVLDSGFSHPFMDDQDAAARRIRLVEEFFSNVKD